MRDMPSSTLSRIGYYARQSWIEETTENLRQWFEKAADNTPARNAPRAHATAPIPSKCCTSLITSLEQVIKLVGRSPRVYPPGTLEALQIKRNASPTPMAVEQTRACHGFGTAAQQSTVEPRLLAASLRTD